MRKPILSLLLTVSFLLTLLAPPALADGPGTRTHIVAAGETLSSISAQYGVSVDAIMAANDLKDPNLIYVGQPLRIPAPLHTTITDMPLTTYQVRRQDTWPGLAKRLGTTPETLLALNGLSSPKYLFLLPEIYIPAPPPSWPEPFHAIDHSPAILQGQTGVLFVSLSQPEPPEATWNGSPLRFTLLSKAGGVYRFQAFLPTGALDAPGAHPLTLMAQDKQIALEVPILAGDYLTQTVMLPPDKGALLEPKTVQEELQKLRAIWTRTSGPRQWRDRFQFPISRELQRTSPYGTRRSYDGGPVSSYHTGSDWSAPAGTPIHAPARGVVVLAENLAVRGGAVIIDHGQGVYSNFWHLSEIKVTPGQSVARNQVVGLVGTTGLSTGAHMHWEIRVNGVAVDPLQWTEVYFPFTPTQPARKKNGPGQNPVH